MPLFHALRVALISLSVAAALFARPTTSLADDELAEMATTPDYTNNFLLLPLIDPTRGRILFVNKGCVLCHTVNGVGGSAAPALDVMPDEYYIDPFAFMVRMWKGAKAMIALQDKELGYQIDIEGDELAAIIGFLYDSEEQKRLTIDQVSTQMRDIFVDEPFEGWVMAPTQKVAER